ncbi:MAG: Gfo/Idh/MocA family oxidoreductase [Clostridiales bacterium]|nr:Gfo/Idh/MocA family oxidoreductase [Clostridiales bacterium]
MRKYNVGIIGCGAISEHYLRFGRDAYADYFQIVALGDIAVERAEARAKQFSIPKYGPPETVYEDESVDIIINLTVPNAHEEVNIKALESGKHVYSEKPLATSREGIKRIMEVAKKCGKRVGCAPDTFMSAPMQTAKKAIEEDWIGKPLGVNALCPMRGNEFWRPDCDFFYKKGAGPMLDMAPYYLNVFVSLFGPIDSVYSMQKMTFPQRTIKVAPRRGEKIDVEIPTHVCASLRFENGMIGSFTNSFDIWASQTPKIEIYGEKGVMVLPDPNLFEGPVLLKRFNDAEWRPLPQFVEYGKYGRGVGVMDMILSIEANKPHKASAELAYHVTDVILSMDEAAEAKSEKKVDSTVEQPDGIYTNQNSILWA